MSIRTYIIHEEPTIYQAMEVAYPTIVTTKVPEMALSAILACIMCGCPPSYECFGNIDRTDETGSSFIKPSVIDIDSSMANS